MGASEQVHSCLMEVSFECFQLKYCQAMKNQLKDSITITRISHEHPLVSS
jgi:hypothetical protein